MPEKRASSGTVTTNRSGLDPTVSRVAVIAHTRRTLGGGLPELRRLLTGAGWREPDWYEVPKSSKAPKKVRQALDRGADLIFVWGGDGMVQSCADTLAGSDTAMAVLPAGTANLLASNLGVPKDLPEAVRIGLSGPRRRMDLGRLNGEHFAVMAGAGFDGDMIADADRRMKDDVGRLAYVWTGLRHIRDRTVRTRVKVDGDVWFDGPASCVLFGNVGTITGGIQAFEDARLDDGLLDVGVATADGVTDWLRTVGEMVVGRADRSPFVQTTRGRKVRVRFDEGMAYELDGGARSTVRKLKARAVPGALTVCVPDRTTRS